MRAIVGRVHHDRVIGDPEFVEHVEELADVAVVFDNCVVVLALTAQTPIQVWSEPFVPLRIPKIFNLRRDPFERADEHSNSYWDWVVEHLFVLYPAQALAAEQLQTFAEFPPRQDPASFNLESVMKAVTDAEPAVACADPLGTRFLAGSGEASRTRRIR